MSDHRSLSLSYFNFASAEQRGRSTKKFKIVILRPVSDEKIDKLKYSLCNVDWNNVLNRLCKWSRHFTTKVVFRTFF